MRQHVLPPHLHKFLTNPTGGQLLNNRMTICGSANWMTWMPLQHSFILMLTTHYSTISFSLLTWHHKFSLIYTLINLQNSRGRIWTHIPGVVNLVYFTTGKLMEYFGRLLLVTSCSLDKSVSIVTNEPTWKVFTLVLIFGESWISVYML